LYFGDWEAVTEAVFSGVETNNVVDTTPVVSGANSVATITVCLGDGVVVMPPHWLHVLFLPLQIDDT